MRNRDDFVVVTAAVSILLCEKRSRIEGSRKRGGLREANETTRGVTMSREMVEAAGVEESGG